MKLLYMESKILFPSISLIRPPTLSYLNIISSSSEITWNCDLDWNFMKNCLPSYNFRILDDYGWNFRHAFYHEENRRTLIKERTTPVY